MSHPRPRRLAHGAGAVSRRLGWDTLEHECWYCFYRDDRREWVLMPVARSFRDRHVLLKQYGLAGICAWGFGAEDPAICNELPVVSR